MLMADVNKTVFFVDGKCDTSHMAYIRIRHGIHRLNGILYDIIGYEYWETGHHEIFLLKKHGELWISWD